MSALDDVLEMNKKIPQGCATQLSEAIAELADLRARLAELEGQNKTLVEPDYDCVYCKDTGEATWILDGKKHTVHGCIYCGKRGKK